VPDCRERQNSQNSEKKKSCAVECKIGKFRSSQIDPPIYCQENKKCRKGEREYPGNSLVPENNNRNAKYQGKYKEQ